MNGPEMFAMEPELSETVALERETLPMTVRRAASETARFVPATAKLPLKVEEEPMVEGAKMKGRGS